MTFTLHNSELEQIIQRQNELLSHIELPAATKVLLDPNPELTAHIACMEQLSVLHSPIYEVVPTLRDLMHRNQIAISNISAGISALSDAIKVLPDLSNISHTISMAAKAMSHIDQNLIKNVATAFQHYADSYQNLYSHIDWESLRNGSLDTSVDGETIESWYDSTIEIADDMVEVGWVAEDEKPVIRRSYFREKSRPEQLSIILGIIASLATITTFTFEKAIPFFSDMVEDTTSPPAIYRDFDEKERHIVTCQTQLNDSITGGLSIEPFDDPFAVNDSETQ